MAVINDYELRCNQCGHEWNRRHGKPLPMICPNKACKTLMWDRPFDPARKKTHKPKIASSRGADVSEGQYAKDEYSQA